MDESRDVIEIPRTGEKFVFLKRPRNTNGELLEIECFVREFAPPERPHIHMKTEERVEVIEGTARLRMGSEERSMGPGETVAIPPGVVHTFQPHKGDLVHFRLEVRPGAQIETLWETVIGLHRDGKSFKNPLQMAVLASEQDTYLAGPPIWLQRPLIALVAAVGRLFGYRSRYEKYSGRES